MFYESFKFITKIDDKSKEAEHQKRFFECMALMAAANPYKYAMLGSKLLFATQNENSSGSIKLAMKRKAMGIKSGVADILFLYPLDKWMDNCYHGLCIELKKPKGKQSPEQKLFQCDVRDAGYAYAVCYGWQEAVETVVKYLEGRL